VQVETISADLSDRSDVLRVAERLEDAARPVELLINNAGFGVHTPLTSTDLEAHDRALDVMCRAVLILSGAAARSMRARGSGTILNVSSTAGFITLGAYSAIKAWVTTFTESLSVELRGSGIQVTALCPGWVRTEFHDRAGIDASGIPGFMWLDADELVAACLRDVDRGRVLSIPTARYRSVIWMLRHVPRGVVRSVSAKISSARDTVKA
jgi:short-subunit dehydrogenase